jgi:hypothetical protein
MLIQSGTSKMKYLLFLQNGGFIVGNYGWIRAESKARSAGMGHDGNCGLGTSLLSTLLDHGVEPWYDEHME